MEATSELQRRLSLTEQRLDRLARVAKHLLKRMDVEAEEHEEFLGATFREELREALAVLRDPR